MQENAEASSHPSEMPQSGKCGKYVKSGHENAENAENAADWLQCEWL